MNEIRKETKYGYLGRTALITAAAAFLAILPALIAGRGMLLLTDDFTWQQQIFNVFNVSAIRSRASWSWVIDLGSDAGTALSFYNYNSPFTIIAAMFPAAAQPFLTAPMLVLKYAAAACGAAVFAKKFVKNKNSAVLCGLLYAFSGIQTVSLLFPFHDSMAIFPWLLAAMEKLLDGKPLYFAAAVMISAVTNFYLFFGEVIFLVIWFVFRVLLMGSTAKQKLVSLGKVAFEGLLGTALAAIVLVPSFMTVASNPRVGNHDFGLFFHVTQYVTILQAYFMPADVMGTGNYLFQRGCSSCALSLPFVAMALVFAYMKGNYKKAKAYLPATLILFSLVPVLNGVFSFFNANYYARWFFMPALIFAMLSCVVTDRVSSEEPAEENENAVTSKDIIFGARLNLLCVVLTMLAEVALVFYYKMRGVASMTEKVNMTMLIIYGAFGQLCAFLMLAVAVKVKPARLVKTLTVCVAAAGVITTSAAAIRYSKGTNTLEYYEPGILNSEGEIGAETAKAILTKSGGLADLFPDGKNYRVRYDWHDEGEVYFADSFDNVSMLTGIPSVNSFISTVEGSLFEFYDITGNPRNVTTKGSFSEEQMALLSARFYLTSNPEGGRDGGSRFGEYKYSEGLTVYVYEYDNCIPMGFTYGSYVTPEEIRSLPEDRRALAMLNHAVLEESDAGEIISSGISLTHGDVSSISSFETSVAERKATAAEEFEMTSSGFTARVNSSSSCVMFVSAPYTKGFAVKVNGAEVKIYKSAGLIAIPLREGENVIRAEYRTPGENAGRAITTVAFVIAPAEVIFVVIREARAAKKKKEEAYPEG